MWKKLLSVLGKKSPVVAVEKKEAISIPANKPKTSKKPVEKKRPSAMQEKKMSDPVKKVVSNVRDLDDAQQRGLISSDWQLLSSPGKLAEVTAAQAQYVALIEVPPKKDRRGYHALVVARDYLMHPETQTVKNALRRKSIKPELEFHVNMSTVRAIYDRVNAFGGGNEFLSTNKATAADKQSEWIRLMEAAAAVNASDIHITVSKHTAVIEMRADGIIMEMKEMPSGPALELCNAVFNMTETSEATYKPLEYQQARMTEGSLKGLRFPTGVQSVRLQFNPLPGGGRYLVARLLYEQKVGSQADIDELGYTRNQIVDIRKMRRKTIGINIICGPTGSGKSTTLQRSLTATLREREGINLITIEDPPEYIIEGARQLPVVSAITQEERTRNFSMAINAVLRDDPDVIMIGEIRDAVSANLAYTAAETGHGVWASLHANSAIGILDRLRDLGLEMFKLCDASKFTGLVSQRLVRKINPEYQCDFHEAKSNNLVPQDVFDTLERLAGDRIGKVRFAATHRVSESRLAYKGRTVCAETILPDQRFLETYGQGKKADALRYWKDELGGMDMLEHAVVLILSGKVDVRSVEEVVGLIEEVDPDRVEKILKLVGDE